jgi:hypothetical protein
MFGRTDIKPQRITEVGHFTISSIYYRVSEGDRDDSYIVNECMLFGNGESGLVVGTHNDHDRTVEFVKSLFDSTNLAIAELFIKTRTDVLNEVNS